MNYQGKFPMGLPQSLSRFHILNKKNQGPKHSINKSTFEHTNLDCVQLMFEFSHIDNSRDGFT